MKVVNECNLSDFEPWGGAIDRWETIVSLGKLSALEAILEDIFNSDTIDEDKLNNLLWFDSEWVYELLDIDSYDKIKEKLKEKQEELECLQEDVKNDLDDNLSVDERNEIIEDYDNQIISLLEEIRDLTAELEVAPC